MPIKIKPIIEPSEIIKEHYSQMGRRRWAKKSTLKRSEYMRRLVNLRWKRMSKKERGEYLKKIGFGGAKKRKTDKTSSKG